MKYSGMLLLKGFFSKILKLFLMVLTAFLFYLILQPYVLTYVKSKFELMLKMKSPSDEVVIT